MLRVLGLHGGDGGDGGDEWLREKREGGGRETT